MIDKELPDRHIEPVGFKPPGVSKVGRLPGAGRSMLVVVWIVLASLMVFGIFLFSSVWVRIAIEPAADSRSVSGWSSLSIGSGFLALPDTEYRLTAYKQGYFPLETTYRTTDAASQVLRAAFEPLPGRLEIVVAPQQAVFQLGDEHYQNSPMIIEDVDPGSYEVTVTADGYKTLVDSIEVTGLGRTQQLDYELQPDWGVLELSVRQAGAQLFVDGEQRGMAAGSHRIASGRHEVVVSLKGFQDWKKAVDIEVGEMILLPEISLEEAAGTLSLVTEPAGANVLINEEYRGQTPLELKLTPNVEHKIQLTRSGYKGASVTARLEPAEIAERKVRLTPVYGDIRFDVQPGDAVLYVNGTRKGQVPARISLVTVPQSIELRRTGYKTFRQTVTPRAGFDQLVSAKLVKTGTGSSSATTGGSSSTARSSPMSAVNANGSVMKLFRGGSFEMGARHGEQGRRSNEIKQTVRITRPFYLSEKEITNAQFRKFLPGHDSGSVQSGYLNGDNQPVVNITWDMAAKYCNWLSRKAGLPEVYVEQGDSMIAKRPLPDGYRLPTEAEWAWAARYGGVVATPQRFPWGNSMPPLIASGNFADESASAILKQVLTGYNDGYASTSETGRFKSSTSGLYDLAGNAAEWTNDYYGISVQTGGKEKIDPLGPESGQHHVVRGSSWMHATISALRWTYRDYSKDKRPDVGFRIARNAQ